MRTRLTLVADLHRGDRVRVDGRTYTIARIVDREDDTSTRRLILSSGRDAPVPTLVKHVWDVLPRLVPEEAAR